MVRRRGRNAVSLVEGHAEGMDIGIIEDPKAARNFYEIISGHPSVYILYKGRKVHYVGQSEDAKGKRVDVHLKDRHADRWDNFSIFRISENKYLDDLETLLIHATKCKQGKHFGAHKNRFVRSSDLKKEFKDIFTNANKSYEEGQIEERRGIRNQLDEVRQKYKPRLSKIRKKYAKRINKFERRGTEKAKKRVQDLKNERNRKIRKITTECERLKQPLKSKLEKIKKRIETNRKNRRKIKRGINRW